MRTQVNIGTYAKVKDVFVKNPELEFSQSFLRKELKIDFYSLKIVINLLLKDHSIKRKGTKYKLKR